MKASKLSLLTLLFFSFLLTNCASDDSSDDTPQETIYEIGDIGPAGGIVFYDKGETTDGWRFIEAAPSDLNGSEWGCYNTPVLTAREDGIGSGLQNTIEIVNFHDAFTDYYSNPLVCSDISNGTVAAKYCYDLDLDGFDDWHLPSRDETYLMYENLHLEGLGNFIADGVILYWTSSEHLDNTATATDFSNGGQGFLCKQCDFGQITKIRPVRYF